MANDLEQLIDYLELMKKVAPNTEEYWMGRDLQVALGYTNWANFESVIRKGIQACEGTGVNPQYHFVESSKMIEAGKGAMVKRADWFLTRYACYLIAMNGDPTKPEIATAQSYFAVQARRRRSQIPQLKWILTLRGFGFVNACVSTIELSRGWRRILG